MTGIEVPWNKFPDSAVMQSITPASTMLPRISASAGETVDAALFGRRTQARPRGVSLVIARCSHPKLALRSGGCPNGKFSDFVAVRACETLKGGFINTWS